MPMQQRIRFVRLPGSSGRAIANPPIIVGSAVLGPLRAAPFVQGYKADTISGGRVIGGGEVRKVTNLNASGPGSLTEALINPGPADVVFEVGGRILMTDNVNQRSNVSVWFQTAPSPGITLIRATGAIDTNRGCLYNVLGTNIVCSHLRLRDRNDLTAPINQSLLFIGVQDPDNGYPTPGAHQVIMDHLSTAWGGDEHAFVQGDCDDITFWRSFMGPTAYAGHTSLVHDGDTTSSNVARLMYQQCYWPLNFDRCPQAKIGSKYMMYNNFLYACGHNIGVGSACFTAFFAINNTSTGIGTTIVSLRGNAYQGNNVNNRPQFEFDQTLGDHSHQYYANDNPSISVCVESPTVVTSVANESDLLMGLPEVATVLPSTGISSLILARAGSRPLNRDFVDTDAVAAVTDVNATPLTGPPPSLYTIGTGSAAFNTPADWNAQAPGEAIGWRVLDKYIYQNYTLPLEG